jgi:hypothetical protein
MIRAWLADLAGVACLFALAYMLVWGAAIVAPCDPETEQCEGQKP